MLTKSPYVHSVPYSYLTRQVEELSLALDSSRLVPPLQQALLSEESLASFTAELVADPVQVVQDHDSQQRARARPLSKAASDALHYAVATRMIVAAARRGQLKRLRLDKRDLDSPFAIRALLPYWVGIERWGYVSDADGYLGAAVSLRRLLAHASLWLQASSDSTTRNNRILTRQDVQSLHSHFNTEGIPKVLGRGGIFAMPISTKTPVKLYLPWLQDEELAQEVADAWNRVVDQGEAEKVECRCDKCTPPDDSESFMPRFLSSELSSLLEGLGIGQSS